MHDVLTTIAHALRDAFLMGWEVWWALALGFAISAVVQAWVPRERVQRALGGSGPRPVAVASTLGAASSSCSYAAIAIARSLFEKGASAATSLAFQFASTNLVIELGIVMWVLLGWRFTLAQLIGGIVLIVAMTLLLRLFVSRSVERRAREHTRATQDARHEHGDTDEQLSWRERLSTRAAWEDVARNYRHDWSMLYKEILTGFVIAGLVGQLHSGVFDALFVTHAPSGVRLLENALVGPLIAVASFVCSIGNVPLAAVLWSRGIGFAGVIAFLFADLIVLPIVAIYRKYYGGAYAWRIVALMLTAIVIAALLVDGLFSLAGLIPHARPTHAGVFGHVRVDYKLFANALGALVFGTLLVLAKRSSSSAPAACCGSVDQPLAQAPDGQAPHRKREPQQHRGVS